jgi:hypothetical protein
MNGMCDVRKAMLGLRASAFRFKTAASEIGERQERAILMIAWLTRKGKEIVSRLLETVAS